MAAARALPLGPVTMFNPYVRGTRLPFRLSTCSVAAMVRYIHSSKVLGQVKKDFRTVGFASRLSFRPGNSPLAIM
jgi:hypothetical protein